MTSHATDLNELHRHAKEPYKRDDILQKKIYYESYVYKGPDFFLKIFHIAPYVQQIFLAMGWLG